MMVLIYSYSLIINIAIFSQKTFITQKIDSTFIFHIQNWDSVESHTNGIGCTRVQRCRHIFRILPIAAVFGRFVIGILIKKAIHAVCITLYSCICNKIVWRHVTHFFSYYSSIWVDLFILQSSQRFLILLRSNIYFLIF